MLEEIKRDITDGLSNHVNSMCATDEEVRICYLLSEVNRVEERLKTIERVLDEAMIVNHLGTFDIERDDPKFTFHTILANETNLAEYFTVEKVLEVVTNKEERQKIRRHMKHGYIKEWEWPCGTTCAPEDLQEMLNWMSDDYFPVYED